MLQSNCSQVNELANVTGSRLVSSIDFCKIKKLTPAILTGLLDFVNFTGYTGQISFPDSLKSIRMSTKDSAIFVIYLMFSKTILLVQCEDDNSRRRFSWKFFNFFFLFE